MYQKQQIIIDMNSPAAMKFYEEQVKGYIDYIENNHYRYDMYDGEHLEDRVIFNVSENEESNSRTITIDEDWTLIFRNRKSVSEEPAPISDFLSADNIKYGRLLREYLAADDITKESVRFRYARRTVKQCEQCYSTNVVEVFDSADMKEPIFVRSDDSCYSALPVNNCIKLTKLPEKKWYLARSWIQFLRCTGMKPDPRLSEFDCYYHTHKELNEFYDSLKDVPVSDEAVKLVEDSKDIVEEFKTLGDVCTDVWERYWSESVNVEEYFLSFAGEMTTSELIEHVDKIDKFRRNCDLVNEKCGCDVSDPYNTTYLCSIMMYSDDFDAVEVFLAGASNNIICRYYENGKTPIVYPEPEKKTKPVQEVPEMTEYEKHLKMARNSSTKQTIFVYNYPELADLLRGVDTADDFDGEVTVDDTIVRIRSLGLLSRWAFEFAYHDKPELLDEIKELFAKTSTINDEIKAGILIEYQHISQDNDDPDNGVDRLNYSGLINYTYYKDFIDSVTDKSYGRRKVRRLWLGMAHECGSSEFSIDHTLGKLGTVSMKQLREVHISADCRQIATEAMIGCEKLTKAFIYSDNVQFPDDKIFVDGVTIYAHSGSTAEAYAEKYGYAFELI